MFLAVRREAQNGDEMASLLYDPIQIKGDITTAFQSPGPKFVGNLVRRPDEAAIDSALGELSESRICAL